MKKHIYLSTNKETNTKVIIIQIIIINSEQLFETLRTELGKPIKLSTKDQNENHISINKMNLSWLGTSNLLGASSSSRESTRNGRVL